MPGLAVRRGERGQVPAGLPGYGHPVRTAVGHHGGKPGRGSEGGPERPGQAVRRRKDVDGRPLGHGGRPEQDEPVAGRRHPGDLRLRAVPGRHARDRRPGRAAVGAQPGDAGLDRHGPLGLAGDLGGDGVPGDQDQLPGRRHGPDVQRVAAARGQAQPRRVEPFPAGPVGRQEDQRSGPGRLAAGHAGAHGDEPVRRPGHGVDLVTGAQRHPVARGQRPGPAVRAGPDRAGTEGDPRALAAGHEDGAVPGRRHAAGRVPDRPHRPGAPVVARTRRTAPAAMRAPACDPTATISSPTLVTRPSVWVMPRPPPAAVKSLPARVAGGKPSEAADGVGPALPLFAPAITTTATPKTTMARIGIATLIPQPRNSRPATNSRDQRRLTGWGRSERSRPAHSAPAALSGPSSRRRGGRPGNGPDWCAGSGPDGCAGRAGPACGGGPDGGVNAAPGLVVSPNSNPGGMNTSSGQACGGACTDIGWLTVGVYRNRRGSAGSGPGCGRGTRPWPGWPGGVPAGRAGLPGAAALELEPGRRPAPRIVVGLTVADRDARDGPGGRSGEGAGSGTRRPGTRGSRRAPGAVSRGMAGRFPCHLCLAVSVIFPADGPRSCTASGG